MEKKCPFCETEISESVATCPNCGKVLSESETSQPEKQEIRKSKNVLAEIGKGILAVVALSVVCLVPQYAKRNIEASITAPAKKNPVSGNRIVNVTKPLYTIKEDEIAYTNIQWAIALCPELEKYIPKDITLVEPIAGNYVKINGNNVSIDLSALAGVTPIVFSDLGDGNVEPSSIPDEQIEVVYGYRDGITLKGTITDFGTTRELVEGQHIHYGKHSGDYDKNVFSDKTIYYINGTIDSVKNNVKSGTGFKSGYRETVYNHDGMFIAMNKTHNRLYTYPGVTQESKESIYNDNDEWTGYRDIEYQAFSRFQILYFPDEDLFQVDILLLDEGEVHAEGSDGQGRHEEETTETDHIYRISMLSDYKMFHSVDEWFDYMGDDYIIVYK